MQLSSWLIRVQVRIRGGVWTQEFNAILTQVKKVVRGCHKMGRKVGLSGGKIPNTILHLANQGTSKSMVTKYVFLKEI